MERMFDEATSFDQNINDWKVGKVTNMKEMFRNASNFNKDISDWDISNVSEFAGFIKNAKNFDKSLNKWGPLLGKRGTEKYFKYHFENFIDKKATKFKSEYYKDWPDMYKDKL